MPRTLYDVLMISPLADRQLMTVAYRHLAKRYHPDIDASPEAAARMAELNDAYAVLGNPVRRAAYDESIGLRPARPSIAPGQEDRADQRANPRVRATEPGYGEAGPPPTNPAPVGPVLTFGRYRGWTLNQVARFDRDYLEWLSRTTMGRNYRRELEALLQRG
jgi:curved DNA-binding protein CbpA